MPVRVLLIDNNDSFTYNVLQTAAHYRRCTVEVRMHDSMAAEDAAAYDKIILSPGPGTPDEYPIMAQVLSRFAATKSILGICLGHQAIALHYGGSLVNLAQVYHGQRRNIEILDADEPLFAGLPPTTPVGLYHSWAVTHDDIPDCLRITSVSENGVVMSLAHTRYDVRGVQFHPESIITDHGRRMLGNWLLR